MSESAAPSWQQRKIQRVEWPSIANRYRQGESLASIARAYNCTAPAIRYIVQRETRRRDGDTEQRRPVALSGAPVALRSVSVPVAGPSGAATGLTADLRDATTGEVANFLVAFDTALEQSSKASLKSLRGATDRLLRAVARVRIALEPIVDLGGNDATD